MKVYVAFAFLMLLTTPSHAEECIASVYTTREGTQTASGQRLNDNALTAAHKTLKFGSMVKVTSHATGKSVVVRITDRGPFIRGRCIDLTTGAARAIGLGHSIVRVTVEPQ